MLEFDAEKHIYRFDGRVVPSVSNIIAPLRDFSGIPPQVLERKRIKGSELHLYIAAVDNGTINPDRSTWDQEKIPYVDAWIRFREQFGFPNAIIDAKTAAKPQKSSGVQLAAYLRLALENPKLSGVSIEEPFYSSKFQFCGTPDRVYWPVDENCLLMEVCLLGKGTFKTMRYDFEPNWKIFKHCLSIYNFRENK